MNKFKIHGECSLSWENNILIIDVEGPCNMEFYAYLHQKILSFIQNIDKSNYAALLLPRGDAVIIVDALPAHVEFLKGVSVKGIAVVLDYSGTPSMTEAMCHKAYENSGIVHQFFEHINDAKSWLTKEVLNG